MSSEAGFVRELDAPEAARGMKDLDADVEQAVPVAFADANDAKLASFLGKAVEDFDASSEGKRKRDAKKGAAAADGNGFRGGV